MTRKRLPPIYTAISLQQLQPSITVEALSETLLGALKPIRDAWGDDIIIDVLKHAAARGEVLRDLKQQSLSLGDDDDGRDEA